MKYFAVGKILAYMLVHNGPLPHLFSLFTYQLLVLGPDNVIVKTDDLYDTDLKERISKVIHMCTHEIKT